jgi:alkylation response protein AidB-like acyl-CoA dehydrogenase
MRVVSQRTRDSAASRSIEPPIPGRERGRDAEQPLWARMHELMRKGSDQLPQPGSGNTAERWRALARIASEDLSLAKVFEGHTDAFAILAELAPARAMPAGICGVWAAESSNARVSIGARDGLATTLTGTKLWCSGAAICDHALVTCWAEDAGPYLAAVDMSAPGVRIGTDGWNAVGMADTRSVCVHFDHVAATLVGAEGAYLDRPGFWHGGAGIAACWYGGAMALAEELVAHLGPRPDAIKLAHLGAVDRALGDASASLREAAAWIDDSPHDDARQIALRVRASVEAAALSVLDHAGRALGASAFCLNRRFARAAADLPVYLRQSHAERDLAALGRLAFEGGSVRWAL